MVSRNSERVEVLDGSSIGALLNLSATGAAFLYSTPLETGCRVVVSVNDVEFAGQVAYCHKRTDGFRIGVHFTVATLGDQMSLGRMVDSFSCGVPLQFKVITVT